jgi:hypothetical protein
MAKGPGNNKLAILGVVILVSAKAKNVGEAALRRGFSTKDEAKRTSIR